MMSTERRMKRFSSGPSPISIFTLFVFSLTVLPLITPRSFPYILFTFLKSVTVTGLLIIFPFLIMCSNDSSEGHANITYNLLAFSAASTYLFVNLLCRFSISIIMVFLVSNSFFFLSILLMKL